MKRLQEIYNGISKLNITNSQIKEASKASWDKLNKYYNKNNRYPTGFVVAICNPRYKLAVFDWLFKDDIDGEKAVNRAWNHFKDTYRQYKERDLKIRAFNVLNSEDLDRSDQEESDNNDIFYRFEGKADQNTISEVDSWLQSATISLKVLNKDISDFRKSKGYDYRIISQIARDYISIPVTSAPSERVFSNGGDIITGKRNRLGGNDKTPYLSMELGYNCRG